MSATTPREREIMRHALGIDPSGRNGPKRGGKPRNVAEWSAASARFRNYFAATPHDDEWESLVERGLATRGRVMNEPPNELQLYHVSDAGLAALS